GQVKGWKRIDTTYYWEAQGYQDKTGFGYWGDAWYRTEFDVPADAKGKDLWLAVYGVYNWGAWVWVNGTMRDFEMKRHWRLGYQEETAPFEVNVTDLVKPGETNDIAILVHTREPGRNPRGGLHGRVFLWERLAESAGAEKEDKAPVAPE
ncbi:MAG: beta galactosidase jelly roll domain-containing protein, partial [Gammaproteobacteria bacterium]|nr:beta galactosidase jelly roll domain-containing protein [Gammaproteobacteria bacterium]